ncbi:T9SS type A sorting domain-containing protein [Polaribacter septentrionalilitoris]|uniref:T9SS type A sorting domain-containing protein n=1 Tax=Polaribacter septentrionalilitoris TaxID=2494657 RepID=UPI00135A490A|nr:T9SS type A sorting domain-containing protein [Polaribacter septentrionalilitoris]
MKTITFNKILSLFTFAFVLALNSNAQSISGVVNTYKTVSAISGSNITLGNTTGLAVDDPVMIIQMTGISGGGNTGGTDNGAGNFHIAKITGVFGATGITIDRPVVKTFSPATEKVQLVKIARYTSDVTVAGTITAQPWNGSTGGIIFIDACQNDITLNADISASGTGFFGRNTNGNEASNGCGEALPFLATPEEHWGTNPLYYGNNYPNFRANSGGTGRGGHGGCDSTQGSPDGGAGVGGDGANSTSSTLSSGGGGGGYGGGGTGGGNGNAVGGFDATPIANVFDTANNLRLFMGATGGSEAEWAPATGNGGGIVIVLADQILGTGDIFSDGDAGPNTGTFTWVGGSPSNVTGGAGGAGYIAIKANSINSNVSAFARGGTATIQSGVTSPPFIELGGPGGGGFIISSVAITTTAVTKGTIDVGNGAKNGADGKVVVDTGVGTVLSLLCAGDACDAVASGNPDIDNDGISDSCDLDSDNDGILDSVEDGFCSQSSQIEWLHNDNAGQSDFATFSGALTSTDYSSSSLITFGSGAGAIGLDETTDNNSFTYVLRDANQSTFAAAKADNDYAQLSFTPSNDLILNSLTFGFFTSSTSSVGFNKGNYKIAVEYATNSSFTSPTLLYQDLQIGDMQAPNGYVTFSENFNSFTLSSGTEYFFRIYMYDEQNTDSLDRIRLDDITFNSSISSSCNNDIDGDGIPNSLDLDSDNDGISDVIESGGQDTNRDGLADGASGPTGVPSSSGVGLSPTSSDGDALPDYLDIDADNDGIPDNIEGQPTSGYIAPSGQGSTIIDANNNGVDDNFEFAGIIGFDPTNTDGIDNPDYLDDDSDNDGILDIVENGDTDNAIVDVNADADGDGLNDIFDDNDDSAIQGATVNDGINPPNNTNLGDNDNDFALGGDVDYRDNPSVTDTDNDGIPDSVDIDDDNDGILDTEEGCTPATGTFTENLSFTTVSGSGFSYNSNNITFGSGSDNYVNSTHSPNLSTYGVTGDFELDFTLSGTYASEFQRGAYIGINESGTNSDFDDDDIDYAFRIRGSGETLEIRENGIIRGTFSTGADGNVLTIRKVGTQITYLVNGGLVYTSGVAANASDYFVDTSFRGQSTSFDLNNFNVEFSTVIDDLDGDGIANCKDLDADNDGIPDNIEAQSTTGYVAPSGVDSDNDGLDDAYDSTPNGTSDGAGSIGLTPVDTDNTGNADYKDLDSDGDGLFDVAESGSGLPNNGTGEVTGSVGTNGLIDAIDNGDNYADVNGSFDDTQTDNFTDTDGDIGSGGDVDYRDIFGVVDTDNDGIADVDDLDDDNDGITDSQELCNTDPFAKATIGVNITFDNYPEEISWEITKDGTPVFSNSYSAANPDGSTVNETYDITTTGTYVFTISDSFGDGLFSPGFYQVTIDNGNTIDGNASPFTSASPIDIDTGSPISHTIQINTLAGGFCLTSDPSADDDSDGTPNYKELSYATANGSTLNAAGVMESLDSDGDGVPNFLDLDSDNDGIPDVTESGGTDTNRDGRADGVVGTTVTTNGIPNTAGTGNTPTNTDSADGDTLPDYLDIDADNDGIPDNIEGQTTSGWVAPSGAGTGITDTNNNGVDDNYENGALIGLEPTNTDAADTPDYQDSDSDNDGITDINENGDTDNALAGTDADGDGLDDNFDDNNDAGGATGYTVNDNHNPPAPGNLGDEDGDVPNGGNVDYRDIFGAIDTDNDGIPDTTDLDDDNDGILDTEEGTCAGFVSILPSDFGFTDGQGRSGTIDISSKFNYPTGSVIVSVSNVQVNNANSRFEVRNDDVAGKATFTFSGKIPVRIRADHGAILPGATGVRDGYISEDGITYTFDNTGFDTAGFSQAGDLSGNFFIEKLAGADNSYGNDINFTSSVFATSISFYSTSTTTTNGFTIEVCASVDTDGDGIPNQFDLDSDNDGIPDVIESGGTDADRDGRADGTVGTTVTTNGIPSSAGTGNTPTNSDFDTIPDYLDIDADNDGIPDNIEGQPSKSYVAPSGVGTGITDANNNGLDDNYETGGFVGINPENTDGTDNPDYTDLDSDNDFIDDIAENGNANNVVSGTDTDGDGLDDNFDDNDDTLITGVTVNDNHNPPAPGNLGDADNDFSSIGDLDYRDTGANGLPIITQVYQFGSEKWIEITNISTTETVNPNLIKVQLYKDKTGDQSGILPDVFYTVTSSLAPGRSVLFRNSANAITNINSNAIVVDNNDLTDIAGADDIITLSSQSNSTSYDFRYDEITSVTDNTSFVRIDETLTANKNYTPSEWVVFIDDDLDPYRLLGAGGAERHPHDPLISEITGSNTNANTLLGLHRIDITTRTGSAWSNGYPDRSRFVVIDEDYNHTSARLSARKLTVNATRKLGVTDNLLVVTNNVVLNGDIRLINSSGATGNSEAQFIQTHTSASLVSGGGRLLVDQNSTVPSKYRYNYIGSPVKNSSGAANYTVASVLKDGTNPTSFNGTINNTASGIARDITFDSGTYDGDFSTTPITLADYWMYTYAANGGTRASWVQKRSSGPIPNTDGFIFKGPDRPQNYTFMGTPKDGNITTTVGDDESYLVANPYASAISVKEFIEDNDDSITGTLYFWEHASEEASIEGTSTGHNFAGYIGGYATRTINMGVNAKQAAGGAIDLNLEAENATIVGGVVENILDILGNFDVVNLQTATDTITFKNIPQGVDKLRLRYRSLNGKTIKVLENKVEKGTFQLDPSPLFDTAEIDFCVVTGSNISFVSTDTNLIQLDYFNLKNDDPNGATSCAPNVGGDGISYTEPQPYIAIGQGFFVSGDANGGTITFNNSQREYKLEGAESVFLRSASKSSDDSFSNLPVIKLGMNFTNTDDDKNYHRQIGVSFSQYTSFAYDKGYDAEIYDIGATDFYWKFPNNEDKYVIAGVSAISNDLEVPLEITMGYSGEVTIKVDEMKNITQSIYITDKVEGKSYEIINGKATLVLEQGVYSNRFVLAFKPTNVLAIDDEISNTYTNIYIDNKNDIVNIFKKQDIEINKVQLFTLLGKQVANWSIKEQRENYQLKIKRKLPTGVYIVKVNSDKGESNKKVIIE